MRRSIIAVGLGAVLAVGCGDGSDSEANGRHRTTVAAAATTPSSSDPVSRTSPETSSSPATSSTVEEAIRTYGSADTGFSVLGVPAGLRDTVVPLTEAVGPVGEFMVTARFTGAELDSQINITRMTEVDVASLVADFETAAAESVAETSPVQVGDSGAPGYIYRDDISGWRVVMWAVSDSSVLYVLASGLTDDEILGVAEAVSTAR